MGDASAACGVAVVVQGCTRANVTTFSVVPRINLAAHEIGNAVAIIALPYYLTPGGTDAKWASQFWVQTGGRSLSLGDAVSDCLTEHYVGSQVPDAGSFVCPSALAEFVVAHIHDPA